MIPESRKKGCCPECGTYIFEVRDYDKTRQEYEAVTSLLKGVRAHHGKEKAEWDIKRIELEEGTKYLQRKVRRQAEAITKLENKLKKRGQQPYAPELTGM